MANRISPDPTQPGRYALERDGQPAVSIRYNESTHSLRFQRAGEQRLLLVERDPFAAGRLQLFSEYGLPSGSCQLLHPGGARGTIRIDGHKFHFERQGDEIGLTRDGKTIERVSWPAPDASPEAIAGILLLLCRETISGQRVPT